MLDSWPHEFDPAYNHPTRVHEPFPLLVVLGATSVLFLHGGSDVRPFRKPRYVDEVVHIHFQASLLQVGFGTRPLLFDMLQVSRHQL